MEKIVILNEKILNDPTTSWSDKGEILNYLFQNGEITFSEFLDLIKKLHSKKSKWLEEKWKELQQSL